MEYKGYTARVVFDQDAALLFGEVEGLRDVVTFEATNVEELVNAFRASVDDYLAMCSERGEEPEKPYSGKFLVRVDTRLHREIAIAAARAGKSLNAFTGEVLKSWIQRDRKSGLPIGVASPSGSMVRAVGEPLAPYLAVEPETVIPGSLEQLSVWDDSARNTPGSITPARVPGPPVTRTPQANPVASRTPSKKVA